MSAPHNPDSHYDAVIIGARYAGAATALLLARSGATVLLVDRQAYGSGTVSTHPLMRCAIAQLNRWGLIPSVVAGGTPAIQPDHGVDCHFAPWRTVLDRLLVHAVISVSLRDGAGACMTVRSDTVIGAEGRQSTVAKLVNAKAYVEGFNASGVVFGHFQGLNRDGLHWHFEKNVAAGLIPTNASHRVFAAVPAAQFVATFRRDPMRGFLHVLTSSCPELRADIDRATLIGGLRRFGGVTAHLRQCHGAGWALVGDAGYFKDFKDPLTAHGITDTLRDAELLSRAIVIGSTQALEAYQHERDALSLPFLRITDAIASFSWSLDEIKELHVRLSAVMQAEASHVASFVRSPSFAA